MSSLTLGAGRALRHQLGGRTAPWDSPPTPTAHAMLHGGKSLHWNIGGGGFERPFNVILSLSCAVSLRSSNVAEVQVQDCL